MADKCGSLSSHADGYSPKPCLCHAPLPKEALASTNRKTLLSHATFFPQQLCLMATACTAPLSDTFDLLHERQLPGGTLCTPHPNLRCQWRQLALHLASGLVAPLRETSWKTTKYCTRSLVHRPETDLDRNSAVLTFGSEAWATTRCLCKRCMTYSW